MKPLLIFIVLFHVTYVIAQYCMIKNAVAVWHLQKPDFRREWIVGALQKITFHTQETYIVLHLDTNLQPTIHYVVGRELPPFGQNKVAEHVVICMQMCSDSNPIGNVRVIRETHDQFSSRFLSIFPQIADLRTSVRHLFKVTEASGRVHIMEVKPDFEQLTQEDVFILNNEEDIYLFSMKQKNSEEKTIKETVGKSLSHLIQEMKGSEMGILFSDRVMEEDDNIRKFFSLLDGGQGKYFNDIAETNGENIKTENSELDLYTLSNRNNFKKNRISVSRLNSHRIKPQDCFVFYDPQLSLEYIYFGSHSQPMEIEKALKYGEILAATESPISVSIVDKIEPSISFLILLQDFVEVLMNDEPAKEKDKFIQKRLLHLKF